MKLNRPIVNDPKQILRILGALEDQKYDTLSEYDIQVAATLISSMTEEDLVEVEEVVKEQMILELSGVEAIFGDKE